MTGGGGEIDAATSAAGMLTVLSEVGYSVNNMKTLLCYDGTFLPW
jgi:hypothetical protein